MGSSRRQQAQADLGMDFAKEDQKREAALAKEQARADKKAVLIPWTHVRFQEDLAVSRGC